MFYSFYIFIFIQKCQTFSNVGSLPTNNPLASGERNMGNKLSVKCKTVNETDAAHSSGVALPGNSSALSSFPFSCWYIATGNKLGPIWKVNVWKWGGLNWGCKCCQSVKIYLHSFVYRLCAAVSATSVCQLTAGYQPIRPFSPASAQSSNYRKAEVEKKKVQRMNLLSQPHQIITFTKSKANLPVSATMQS